MDYGLWGQIIFTIAAFVLGVIIGRDNPKDVGTIVEVTHTAGGISKSSRLTMTGDVSPAALRQVLMHADMIEPEVTGSPASLADDFLRG